MSRRAGRWSQLVSAACLVALILLPALKGAAVVPGAFLTASALLAGCVFATGYARMRSVRLFLTILSPAVLLFPALFLFRAPVRTLLFPADAPAHSVPYIQIESTDPVVMLVLDELPLYSLLDGSDRLDPVRYPNLAALARDAYWFRNASTTATGTGYAVPALLTGRFPRRRGLPTAKDYPENLFTLLAGSGYRVHAVEAQTRLCPRAVCRDGEPDRDAAERMTAVLWDVRVVYLKLVLPSDLTTHLPAVDAIWKGFGARREAKGPRKRRDGEASSDAGLEPAGVPREFAKFLNMTATFLRTTTWSPTRPRSG